MYHKFTVIIRTYKRALLKDVLESLISQSYSLEIEIIVIDNDKGKHGKK